MKRILFVSACLLAAGPVISEEPEGRSLMERGAQLFFEGLMQEMDPALEDLEALGRRAGPALRGFIAEMGPALTDLMDEIDDWSAYHPPERLENGDIIIRRKRDLPETDDIEL